MHCPWQVRSRAAVEDLLAQGNMYRTTSATGCNEVSSRSHAVLQLQLETHQEDGAKAIGKLALIDLAGSERATKTENRGERLNEGANINRSLLALANCINALVGVGGRGHTHVPYRDSKLTRLLKDSLGGHSCTCIITNVSPASDQFEETINTLKYANRAKNIKTKTIYIRVERPPPPPKHTFAPSLKYDAVSPAKARGVEDFLVRHEKARLRKDLANLKRVVPSPTRVWSSPVRLCLITPCSAAVGRTTHALDYARIPARIPGVLLTCGHAPMHAVAQYGIPQGCTRTSATPCWAWPRVAEESFR